ncbi:MAG: protein kinase [Myxococcales bacterium]|nr:protein kinase [Myxococcales bacterium]
MSDAPTIRFCPQCGTESTAAYCDNDGTRTVARRDLAAGTAKLEIGQVVSERYRITGMLGRGGFGAVYAAEHTGTGQAIALKVMVVGDGGAPDVGAVRRFYKEAQVTAQLRHPNTVRVFDVGQTHTGALYIAMELLHGDTLEERLVAQAAQGQVLGQWPAIDMAIAVLRSLGEAHSRELVHRDLKPANIILSEVTADEEPIPKVLDFGIARTQDSSLTGQGTALGTPAYMSPEQCMGGKIDGRSDVYSLGVILYRCVTGRLPFDDRNPLTIMYKHAHAAPPPVSEASRVALQPGFVAVVERALAKAPDDRFATAKSMRSALEALQRGPQAVDSSRTEKYAVDQQPDALPAGSEIDHFGDTVASDVLQTKNKTALTAPRAPVANPATARVAPVALPLPKAAGNTESGRPRTSTGKWIALVFVAAIISATAAWMVSDGRKGAAVTPVAKTEPTTPNIAIAGVDAGTAARGRPAAANAQADAQANAGPSSDAAQRSAAGDAGSVSVDAQASADAGAVAPKKPASPKPKSRKNARKLRRPRAKRIRVSPKEAAPTPKAAPAVARPTVPKAPPIQRAPAPSRKPVKKVERPMELD